MKLNKIRKNFTRLTIVSSLAVLIATQTGAGSIPTNTTNKQVQSNGLAIAEVIHAEVKTISEEEANNLNILFKETTESEQKTEPEQTPKKEPLNLGPESNGLLEHLYTQEDINLLASLIQSEAGNDASSDELQQWVGQVVINRMKSPLFKPTTIYGVIHQKGQYSTANNLKKPTDRALKNAQIVLEGKSTCPRDVIFQANFKQGIVVRAFPDKTLGTTSYFGKKA